MKTTAMAEAEDEAGVEERRRLSVPSLVGRVGGRCGSGGGGGSSHHDAIAAAMAAAAAIAVESAAAVPPENERAAEAVAKVVEKASAEEPGAEHDPEPGLELDPEPSGDELGGDELDGNEDGDDEGGGGWGFLWWGHHQRRRKRPNWGTPGPKLEPQNPREEQQHHREETGQGQICGEGSLSTDDLTLSVACDCDCESEVGGDEGDDEEVRGELDDNGGEGENEDEGEGKEEGEGGFVARLWNLFGGGDDSLDHSEGTFYELERRASATDAVTVRRPTMTIRDLCAPIAADLANYDRVVAARDDLDNRRLSHSAKLAAISELKTDLCHQSDANLDRDSAISYLMRRRNALGGELDVSRRELIQLEAEAGEFNDECHAWRSNIDRQSEAVATLRRAVVRTYQEVGRLRGRVKRAEADLEMARIDGTFFAPRWAMAAASASASTSAELASASASASASALEAEAEVGENWPASVRPQVGGSGTGNSCTEGMTLRSILLPDGNGDAALLPVSSQPPRRRPCSFPPPEWARARAAAGEAVVGRPMPTLTPLAAEEVVTRLGEGGDMALLRGGAKGGQLAQQKQQQQRCRRRSSSSSRRRRRDAFTRADPHRPGSLWDMFGGAALRVVLFGGDENEDDGDCSGDCDGSSSGSSSDDDEDEEELEARIKGCVGEMTKTKTKKKGFGGRNERWCGDAAAVAGRDSSSEGVGFFRMRRRKRGDPQTNPAQRKSASAVENELAEPLAKRAEERWNQGQRNRASGGAMKGGVERERGGGAGGERGERVGRLAARTGSLGALLDVTATLGERGDSSSSSDRDDMGETCPSSIKRGE